MKSQVCSLQGERRSSQAAADFKTGYKAADGAPMEAGSDPEEQGPKDVRKTQDSGLVGKRCQSEELRDVLQGIQN